MTDEQDVFDRAEADCLGECFKVLRLGLSGGDAEAAERFRRCCETCRKAREIARGK